MKANYWDVTDAQVEPKTGKTLRQWDAILDRFGAASKPSNEVAAHLHGTHDVPRYWARTLTTRYLKLANASARRST